MKMTKHSGKQNYKARGKTKWQSTYYLWYLPKKRPLYLWVSRGKEPFYHVKRTMCNGNYINLTHYTITYPVLEALHRYTDQAICSSQILLITFYAVTKKLSVKILASRLHKNTKSRSGYFLKLPLTAPVFSSHPGRISPHLLIWVT